MRSGKGEAVLGETNALAYDIIPTREQQAGVLCPPSACTLVRGFLG